jgi:hypothetical protein
VGGAPTEPPTGQATFLWGDDQFMGLTQGSVALSLRTTAYPLDTRTANIFGASIPETTMRPNPRLTLICRLAAGTELPQQQRLAMATVAATMQRAFSAAMHDPADGLYWHGFNVADGHASCCKVRKTSRRWANFSPF